MKPLLLKVVFKPARRYADDSIGLSQVTAEEVSTEDFKIIDEYRGQTGYIMFKPNAPKVEDMPIEDAKVPGELSPSQKLRKKIIALHYRKGGTKEGVADYYKKVMAGLEQSVQAEIDQIED